MEAAKKIDEGKATAKDRKPIFIALGILLSIIIIYFGYQHIMYVTTDDAQIDGHYVLLAAKVAGYVNVVHVIEGQKVKKGDVLIEIDDRDYKNTLDQEQADLAAVQVNLQDAERNYKRLSELFKNGAVSRQQYDNASAAYFSTKAKFDAITARVAQAQLNLENTKIMAPADGQIAKSSVEVGQLASPGVPLVGFVDSTERWVEANFKETDLSSIHNGAAVDVSVDAIPSRTFDGRVAAMSSATGATFSLLPPDNATGNFTKVVQRVPIRINLPGLSPQAIDELRVGLSATVKVHKH